MVFMGFAPDRATVKVTARSEIKSCSKPPFVDTLLLALFPGMSV